MKPGCIYPSLSDIESHSEAPDSQDEDVKDSRYVYNMMLPPAVCAPARKPFTPKKKPGFLYPSLSDIESRSEISDSQDEETDSRYDNFCVMYLSQYFFVIVYYVVTDFYQFSV